MGILSVDLNNINLDHANCYEDDPKTIIHVILVAWNSNALKSMHLLWSSIYSLLTCYLQNQKTTCYFFQIKILKMKEISLTNSNIHRFVGQLLLIFASLILRKLFVVLLLKKSLCEFVIELEKLFIQSTT